MVLSFCGVGRIGGYLIFIQQYIGVGSNVCLPAIASKRREWIPVNIQIVNIIISSLSSVVFALYDLRGAASCRSLSRWWISTHYSLLVILLDTWELHVAPTAKSCETTAWIECHAIHSALHLFSITKLELVFACHNSPLLQRRYQYYDR